MNRKKKAQNIATRFELDWGTWFLPMIYHSIKYFSEHPLCEICISKENANPYWFGPIIHPQWLAQNESVNHLFNQSTHPQNYRIIHPSTEMHWQLLRSSLSKSWRYREERQPMLSQSSQLHGAGDRKTNRDNPMWWVLIQWEVWAIMKEGDTCIKPWRVPL